MSQYYLSVRTCLSTVQTEIFAEQLTGNLSSKDQGNIVYLAQRFVSKRQPYKMFKHTQAILCAWCLMG